MTTQSTKPTSRLVRTLQFLAVMAVAGIIWPEQLKPYRLPAVQPVAVAVAPTSRIPTGYRVTYRVWRDTVIRIEEDSPTTVSYQNATGGTDTAELDLTNLVDHPWERTFEGQPGQFLYVDAHVGPVGQGVNVDILVNGVVVKHVHAQGEYSNATASGTL